MTALETLTPVSQPALAPRPARILACHQCQQRKIKCNRSFPCIHCTKARLQCVPATLTPRRRRRHYPETELLDRIRKYEELLHRNRITFDPFDDAAAESTPRPPAKSDHSDAVTDSSGADIPSPARSETLHEPKNLWRALNQGPKFRTDDDQDDISVDELQPATVREALEGRRGLNSHFLFASPQGRTDLSTLHPNAAQTFQLWQIYLNHVDPLLKVTHTPTLQSRIVSAASQVASMDVTFEALMFGIFCMAIVSLDDGQCIDMFQTARDDLLTKYQFACEQALINANFLQGDDRECLTAYFLYLSCTRESQDARTQSSMMAIAIRTAQRLGLHIESQNQKHDVLEAELRRRLWWALVLLDARSSELSNHRTTSLLPTWDCAVPSNLNDSDLQSGAKAVPVPYDRPTEAIFVTLRGELGNFLRHADFHLDFNNPSLMTLDSVSRRHRQEDDGGLAAIQKDIDERYLQYCSPENTLQMLAIQSAWHIIARFHVIRFYAQYHDPAIQKTDQARNRALRAAMTMLESDTVIAGSPSMKGFQWLSEQSFPFVAYVFIAQTLQKAAFERMIRECWMVMTDNFQARFPVIREDEPRFRLFAKVMLQAWEVHRKIVQARGESMEAPLIIRRMLDATAQVKPVNRDLSLQASLEAARLDDPSTLDQVTSWGNPMLLDTFDATTFDINSLMNLPALDTLVWPDTDWNPTTTAGWSG